MKSSGSSSAALSACCSAASAASVAFLAAKAQPPVADCSWLSFSNEKALLPNLLSNLPADPSGSIRRMVCVVQDANTGHDLAGGNSSWCPELEIWTNEGTTPKLSSRCASPGLVHPGTRRPGPRRYPGQSARKGHCLSHRSSGNTPCGKAVSHPGFLDVPRRRRVPFEAEAVGFLRVRQPGPSRKERHVSEKKGKVLNQDRLPFLAVLQEIRNRPEVAALGRRLVVAQSEVTRAICCSLSALHHNPR